MGKMRFKGQDSVYGWRQLALVCNGVHWHKDYRERVYINSSWQWNPPSIEEHARPELFQ